MTKNLLSLLILIGVVGVMFGFQMAALAHIKERPELNAWFDQLKSGKGLCCSVSDGVAVPDVDWESLDGHYRAKLEGVWFEVEDSAVIEEPNRAGVAMAWPYYADGHVHHIRCFIPGSMS